MAGQAVSFVSKEEHVKKKERDICQRTIITVLLSITINTVGHRDSIYITNASNRIKKHQFNSVQFLFSTPQISALQASLSITNSQSLLKLMSIESVMPSKNLILCCPLHHLPSIIPSIRVFSNELVLCIRCPKY